MMNVPITSYFSPKDWLNIRYGDIIGDAEVWYLYFVFNKVENITRKGLLNFLSLHVWIYVCIYVYIYIEIVIHITDQERHFTIYTSHCIIALIDSLSTTNIQ